jgi:hypothetical protein
VPKKTLGKEGFAGRDLVVWPLPSAALGNFVSGSESSVAHDVQQIRTKHLFSIGKTNYRTATLNTRNP